ncbi:MAG: hypothetical protein ICV64_10375 [Thermoleophilia bacterium]|nr:hypothetical protein [Thermoleophilia bacterium]
MVCERRSLLHEIAALIDAADAAQGSPSVARLEHTLTSGYAHALALEGERLRLEQRLGEATQALEAGRPGAGDELTELSARVAATDAALRRLRAMLLVLRERARAARAAA